MLVRSRVTGTLDTGRAAEALSRPGIDPRTWISLAIVTAVRVDPAQGVICDVTLMPSELQDSARVGTPYAGQGWGAHFPLAKDDEVLVAAPNGDPNQGLVVVARLYSGSDPPPPTATKNSSDASITAKPSQSLRFVTSLAGKIIAASSSVLLGDETAIEQLLLGTSYRAAEVVWHAALSPFLFGAFTFGTAAATQFPIISGGFTAASNASGLTPLQQDAINAAAAAATALGVAGTALAAVATAASTALATFEAGAAKYLSLISKSK